MFMYQKILASSGKIPKPPLTRIVKQLNDFYTCVYELDIRRRVTTSRYDKSHKYTIKVNCFIINIFTIKKTRTPSRGILKMCVTQE